MTLLRNALANALGGIVPALAALVAMPFIVYRLGTADYGLLTLIASVVGYFAIIELKVSAGAVKFVAEFRARGEWRAESAVVVLGLALAVLIGAVGCLGIVLFAEPIITRLFAVPAERVASSVFALRIAGLGFFFAQIQQFLQSLPQALQRYSLSAATESLFGVLVPLLTVSALLLGGRLEEAVMVRVACSAANAALLAWLCRGLFPRFEWRWPRPALARQVLSFSGFAYLSHLSGLTYAHADKLIIGGTLGMEAVAYFSIAATLANRALAITMRLSGILYPAASALAATGQWQRLKDAYFNTARYVFCLNGGVVLLITLFAPEIMRYWMGREFAAYGQLVLVLTALGMLADSLTNLPSTVNDGLGHTRVSGPWAFARAVVGVALIVAFIGPYGIDGVAAAHLVTSLAMTTLFLRYVHGRTVPFSLSELLCAAYLRPGLVLACAASAGALLRPHRLLSVAEALALAAILAGAYVAALLAFVVPREHVAMALYGRRRVE